MTERLATITMNSNENFQFGRMIILHPVSFIGYSHNNYVTVATVPHNNHSGTAGDNMYDIASVAFKYR
jgi:hypothetical protein